MVHSVSQNMPLGLRPHFLAKSSSSESEEIDNITTDDRGPIQLSTPSTTINRKRGHKGIDYVIAGAILEMAVASKLRTAAAQQCNARYSIADCIKELDEMQGLEEHVSFAATDLFNKPYARETFLSLKADKRLIWLRRKCNPYSTVLVDRGDFLCWIYFLYI